MVGWEQWGKRFTLKAGNSSNCSFVRSGVSVTGTLLEFGRVNIDILVRF
jgi:hypothetical protein